VFGAATANAPQYRKRGLVDKCLAAINRELLTRVRKREGEDGVARRVLSWIRAADEANGDYWRKKGYVQVGGISVIPKGVWSHDRDFHVVTMFKEC